MRLADHHEHNHWIGYLGLDNSISVFRPSMENEVPTRSEYTGRIPLG